MHESGDGEGMGNMHRGIGVREWDVARSELLSGWIRSAEGGRGSGAQVRVGISSVELLARGGGVRARCKKGMWVQKRGGGAKVPGKHLAARGATEERGALRWHDWSMGEGATVQVGGVPGKGRRGVEREGP